jgi:hypothetical protein
MILDESNPEYMNLRIGVLVEDFGLQISTTGDSINILFKELWLQNHCVKLKKGILLVFKDAYPIHCCCTRNSGLCNGK